MAVTLFLRLATKEYVYYSICVTLATYRNPLTRLSSRKRATNTTIATPLIDNLKMAKVSSWRHLETRDGTGRGPGRCVEHVRVFVWSMAQVTRSELIPENGVHKVFCSQTVVWFGDGSLV